MLAFLLTRPHRLDAEARTGADPLKHALACSAAMLAVMMTVMMACQTANPIRTMTVEVDGNVVLSTAHLDSR